MREFTETGAYVEVTLKHNAGVIRGKVDHHGSTGLSLELLGSRQYLDETSGWEDPGDWNIYLDMIESISPLSIEFADIYEPATVLRVWGKPWPEEGILIVKRPDGEWIYLASSGTTTVPFWWTTIARNVSNLEVVSAPV